MKKRLIILSDLWGSKNSDWVSQYSEVLKEYFEIQFYDCRELGEVNIEDSNQESIHQQFLSFGIEKAVTNLLEKEQNALSILAFSIGGSIAWEATLKGLKADYICALSSTRLRFESQKPNVNIDLFFAENDPYKPNKDWFLQHKIDYNLYKNKAHEIYKEPEVAKAICRQIIT